MKTLGYIILSFLATEGEMTGYGLSTLMKPPIAQYWQARHSQIYPELARLEADGYVTHQQVEQDDKPDKKVYAITDKGQQILSDWVSTPSDIQIHRDDFMLKMLSLWLGDHAAMIPHLQERATYHREQLDKYEQFMSVTQEQWDAAGQPRDTPDFGRYIVLLRLIERERHDLQWCQQVIALLKDV